MRITVISDVSGRLTRTGTGGSRATAGAVVIPTEAVREVSDRIGSSRPKWGCCARSDADSIVDLMLANSLAVAAVSWTLTGREWEDFWTCSKALCASITKDDRSRVSFAQPSSMAKCIMMSSVAAIATARAIACSGLMAAARHEPVRVMRRLIVDSEFSGEEMLGYLQRLWVGERDYAKTRAAGIHVVTTELEITSEQSEPLLILADYAAGLVHASLIEDAGRIRLPLPQSEAQKVLNPLVAAGLLTVINERFNLKVPEIYGPL